MKKFFALGLTAILLAVDQLLQMWGMNSLKPIGQIEIIPNLFNLTYVENRGAAFGIFQGGVIPLAVVSGILLVIVVAAILLNKFKSDFMLWAVAVGLAGGIGNLIDRSVRGFVVDYLDFSALFGFPVFNLADCCIVSATCLILIYIIKTDRKAAKDTKAVAESNGDNV